MYLNIFICNKNKIISSFDCNCYLNSYMYKSNDHYFIIKYIPFTESNNN